MSRILVVDDEDEVRSALQRRLERAGHNVQAADSVAEGIKALDDDCPVFDVVVTDMVECMQLGAFDYLEKNIPDVDVFELLMLKVDRALQQRQSTVRTLERLSRLGQATA